MTKNELINVITSLKIDLKYLKKDLQSIVDNFSHWRSMSQSSSKVCDGLGANRVVKYLQ